MIGNQRLLMAGGETPHVLMTVGRDTAPVYGDDLDIVYKGWIRDQLGKMNRIPFWKTVGVDRVLKAIYIESNPSIILTIVEKDAGENDYMGDITISINGVSRSYNLDFRQTTSTHGGDIFDLENSVGKVLPVMFDPPPTDIYKKIKQVFTRSRKEGVVKAWNENVAHRCSRQHTDGSLRSTSLASNRIRSVHRRRRANYHTYKPYHSQCADIRNVHSELPDVHVGDTRQNQRVLSLIRQLFRCGTGEKYLGGNGPSGSGVRGIAVASGMNLRGLRLKEAA